MSDAEEDAATKPALLVDELLAFSDAELAEYMGRHRGDDGAFNLDDIDGWELLPDDKRDRLAQRLKFGAELANEAHQSRPVDAGQVAARLLDLSAAGRDPSASPPPNSRRFERSPTREWTDDDEIRRSKQFETASHTWLVADGCRPPYPISLLDRVAEDPEPYRETLLPWQEYPDNPDPEVLRWDAVFEKQRSRWDAFRAWQRDCRGTLDAETEYLAFAAAREGTYRILSRGGTDDAEVQSRAQLGWKYEGQTRSYDRHYLREGRTYHDFPDYVEHVRRRLSQHGFTRPFELAEDPAEQDQMATWIEYLNYEYAWLDRDMRMAKRLQADADQAWSSLVALDVLLPHETLEFLRTADSRFERTAELKKAEVAVALAGPSAKAASREVDKAKDGRSRFTEQQVAERLAAAQARLARAESKLADVRKRQKLISDCLSKHSPYWRRARNVLRQELLLKWALAQVPVIAAEEEAKGQTKKEEQEQLMEERDGQPKGEVNRQRKRARPSDTTVDGEEPARKRRQSRPSSPLPQPPLTPPPPRRSARVAAKQQAASAPVHPLAPDARPPVSRPKGTGSRSARSEGKKAAADSREVDESARPPTRGRARRRAG